MKKFKSRIECIDWLVQECWQLDNYLYATKKETLQILEKWSDWVKKGNNPDNK